MLASISKIKSFRETGEFDMSGLVTASEGGTTQSINDVNLEAPQDHNYQSLRANRCSD